ncbi:MAG: S-layer homology domain-containing protein [Oscillospiraceae bacterium]|nr:S-layer homology domain-containing protein [Oscillospiraceae bacterium]
MRKRLVALLLTAALFATLGCGSFAAADSGGLDCSEALITYLAEQETYYASIYADSSGYYIGYGCAVSPGDYPNGITEAEAEALMRERLADYAAALNDFASENGVSLTQGQFDALCALSYNVGTSWMDSGNRLPTYLINGLENYSAQEIGTAYGAWCHIGMEVSEPLLYRRIMELNMLLYEDYSCETDNWCWLLLDAAGGVNDYSDVALYPSGEAYGVLPVATRDGWTLTGWADADGTVLAVEDIAAENRSVTAVWGTEAAGTTETADATATTGTEEPTQEGAAGVFSDVAADAWYADYVETLNDQGVVNGYEDGTFRPDGSVTWGEALKLILRSAGFAEQTAASGEHWAAGYLAYATQKEYLPEDADVELDAAITRDEMADLCAAVLELEGGETGGESPFADSDRASVLALYAAGIVEGSVENGVRLYKGTDEISRAETCAVLMRVLDYADAHFTSVSGIRVAINDALTRSAYDETSFYTATNGRVYCTDTSARYGIDVSYYQGGIDWEKVAADGIDFVIIRCGYRGYGKGSINTDPCFTANIEGALAAGLNVGVYFFSQAVTVEEALEEAAFTLSMIEGYDITFPVVFDWEQVTASGSRTASPDWDAVADCMIAFCDAVAEAGYTPMTYFNKTMAYLRLDMTRLQDYDGWLAWYHDTMDYVYDFQMWQYSSSGSVAGISGSVDMNICFVDYGA